MDKVKLVEIVKLDNGYGNGYGTGYGYGYSNGYGTGNGYGDGSGGGYGNITDKTIDIAIWAKAGAEI